MVGEIENPQEGGWTDAWISTIGRRHVWTRSSSGGSWERRCIPGVRSIKVGRDIYRAGCMVSVLEWNWME